ncbi:cancer/testis antigen 55-like [Meriones unguiculatus]|uniref:cancer/testis antigen 55-like n=1 Tax=Meriones unguiculatus TaxID=10047 RepID=UPI000B4FBBE0|nr:cancer/testis antigen 55-like [Meriones unguiculatus]
MGVMISRSSCCYCRCCFFDCGFSRFLMMLRRELYFFQWRIESVERDREQLEGEPNTKIVKGIVTSCGHDYVWIEECIFFSTDDFIDPMPLQAGDKVVAFVEEDPLSHELKATEVCVVIEDDGPREPDCKIQYLSACVSHVKKDIIYIADEYYFYLDSISKAILGFSPYGGDWLDIEYSVQHDSSKITIHSLKATKCRQLEEVCVTSIHKGQGMLNYSIFFTFRSLNLPTGYTPHLGHMVSVVIIQSIRPKYNWRAISMTPVKKV